MRNIITLFTIGFIFIQFHASAQEGAIDPTFNPQDTGYSNGTDSFINAISVQADGKIILGGSFQHYLTVPRSGIVRINSDETLDNTYQIGTGVSGSVVSTALQTDGKLIIAGQFSNFNGTTAGNIARPRMVEQLQLYRQTNLFRR